MCHRRVASLGLPTSGLMLFLAACGSSPPSAPQEDVAAATAAEGSSTPGAAPAEEAEAGTHRASGADTAPVGPPSAEAAAKLATAINDLGAGVYRQLSATQSGNFAVSPASIHVALTMTWAGARGETAEEMAGTLHLGALGDGADPAAVVGGQLGVWNGAESITLRTANRLFGEQTYEFQADFLASTERKFGAPLEGLSFATNPEGSRKHINDWVMKQTEDRIEDLIPPGGIDNNTRLVLTNAVYFLADWAEPFVEGLTSDATFHAPGGDVQVPMMRATRAMRNGRVGAVQLVELEYRGGDYAMLVALPDVGTPLAEVEGALSAAQLASWRAALGGGQVQLSLPRFEIDPAGSVALKQALRELGMKLAFQAGVADFTGIADPPDEGDRLYVSEVFHQCFVKVDEKGTEAAAATAVVMGRGGSAAPPEPVVVTVDRPFLFFVVDEQSGAVLFMGRVLDPSAEG